MSSDRSGEVGMPLIRVDDLTDERLAIYRDLKRSNATRDLAQFVLEGEKLLDRLLGSEQFPVASVLASEQRADACRRKVPKDVPVFVLDETRLSQLVGYRFHLGVLSAGVRKAWHSLNEHCARKLRQSDELTIVVCPATNDPENLGSIARTADVLGADGLLAGPDCPDPLSRRVLRVSMGAVLRLPIWIEADVVGVLETLKQSVGLKTAAAVTDLDATPIDSYARAPALALVVGNEAQGLPPEWVARCDERLTIPMRDGADSLNVGAAVAIMLHRLLA